MTAITQIHSVAKQVIRNLMVVTFQGEATTITTPVLAYGHTFVTVRMVPHGNSIMVSDGGFARREVELIGGSAYFDGNAHRIAHRYGIKCNGDLLFSIEGHNAIDEITAAVAAVANAAKDAVETIAEKLADREVTGVRERLFATLRQSFGRSPVVTGSRAKLPGATGDWDFDAVVDLPTKRLALIVVTPYPNSVTTAFSKFSDVRLLNAPDRRTFGVLTDQKGTPRLKLISDVATLVPIERSSPELWKSYADAA